MSARWILLLGAARLLTAQQACEPTPLYQPCDIVLEMSEEDARRFPRPYEQVQVQAEVRSPEYKTYLVQAFWDGGRKLVFRFSPNEVGKWTFRITGNLTTMGQQGNFEALASEANGFLRPAVLHHWRWTGSGKPHLWMGDTNYRFATIPRTQFDQYIAARAKQKFNHVRGLVFHDDTYKDGAPNLAYFRELEARIAEMNRAGIVADLILGSDENQLVKQFPAYADRERYLRYVVARLAAFNVTWQLVQEFEEYPDGREVLRQLGTLLKKIDPYNHPRTTHTTSTSSPLLADGWMDHLLYQSSDDALGAIEHQLYAVPQVNAEFGYEDSGAGKSHAHHVDSTTFTRRLWNATMNGQYPTFGNTGTYGGRKFGFDAKYLESPGANAMQYWHEFMSRTRWWDLQPYFDVDGGRALALPTVEYIVYIEKPGPIEVTVEKHEYQVYWFNPYNGQYIKEKKDWKGEVFQAQPPDNEHEWVLHLSRDGRKEGMAKSYRFEARIPTVQEVEVAASKVPYELAAPAGKDLPSGVPVPFEIKLKRETRATRNMMFLLTGEVARDGQGTRVLGSGVKGQLKVPPQILKSYPGTMVLRVYGLNAYGKLYSSDAIVTVVKP